MRRSWIAMAAATLVAAHGAAVGQDAADGAEPTKSGEEETRSILKVNATVQDYDFFRPWEKEAPSTRSGVGALLADGRILVSAEMVANATFVELELPTSGKTVPASVTVADNSANLALVEPEDPGFLDGMKPLELIDQASIGDTFEAWQLEPTGTLLRTEALLTSVQVIPYPQGDLALLAYQLTSALQSRDGSFTIPLIRDGRLAGVIMRYSARSQNMTAIPAEVIAHFLKDAGDGEYKGFPKAGIGFSDTRDPQLRGYLGLEPDNGGVYVDSVQTGLPAHQAGIRIGDVLLEVAGSAIDADGNYEDARYGKLSLANLISLKAHSGDTVAMSVFRDGERMTFDVEVESQSPDDYVSPPYVIGRGPDFLIVGGLIFQELSREYLEEWGGKWKQKANSKLVYYDHFQSILFDDPERRIVFLSQVIPTPATLGYRDLDHLVVTKVNDREIHSLSDLKSTLKSPVGGYHRFLFEDDPKLIILDPQEAKDAERALMENYGLPALERLEVQPAGLR